MGYKLNSRKILEALSKDSRAYIEDYLLAPNNTKDVVDSWTENMKKLKLFYDSNHQVNGCYKDGYKDTCYFLEDYKAPIEEDESNKSNKNNLLTFDDMVHGGA